MATSMDFEALVPVALVADTVRMFAAAHSGLEVEVAHSGCSRRAVVI